MDKAIAFVDKLCPPHVLQIYDSTPLPFPLCCVVYDYAANASAVFSESCQYHVALPAIPPKLGVLRSFTAWVRLDPKCGDFKNYSSGCGAYVLGSSFWNGDKYYGLSLLRDGAGSRLYVAEHGGPNLLISNVFDDQWHHLAQSDQKVYIDGKLVGDISNKLHSAQQSLRIGFGPIGKVGYPSTKGANIAIRDVRLFSAELAPADVEKCARNAPASAKPILHLPLLHDAKDVSGNELHGMALDAQGRVIEVDLFQPWNFSWPKVD